MGIVYLIQPAELISTNRYKIGMSSLDNLSRLKAYKRGTRHLCIFECDDALIVERKLIVAFNARYNLIAGNEYFEVDCEKKMLSLFIDVVMQHKNGETKAATLDWKRFAYRTD